MRQHGEAEGSWLKSQLWLFCMKTVSSHKPSRPKLEAEETQNYRDRQINMGLNRQRKERGGGLGGKTR